jgi:ABC-2 type transport system permease protein
MPLPRQAVFLTLGVPLLASVVLGYQFSPQKMIHVPTAVVDLDGTSLSRTLVHDLERTDAMTLTAFPGSEDELAELLQTGQVAVGFIIPRNFAEDLKNSRGPKVLTLYDGAQMGAVSNAKAGMTEVLATIRAGFVAQVMTGRLGMTEEAASTALQSLGYTIRILGNPSKSLAAFLLFGILMSVWQMTAAILGCEIAHQGRPSLGSLWTGLGLSSAVAAASFILCLIPPVLWFGLPFRGPGLELPLLAVPASAALITLGAFLRLAVGQRAITLSIIGLLPITMLLSGITFPSAAMPVSFRDWSSALPYSHFALPLRDWSLLGGGAEVAAGHALWLLSFAVAAGGLATWLWNWRRQRLEAAHV